MTISDDTDDEGCNKNQDKTLKLFDTKMVLFLLFKKKKLCILQIINFTKRKRKMQPISQLSE